MASLVICGGQSGADLGGWRGATSVGVPARIRTFIGFEPQDGELPPEANVEWLTPPPWAYTYSQRLRWRTIDNVCFADRTVIFYPRLPIEGGSLLTLQTAERWCLPVLTFDAFMPTSTMRHALRDMLAGNVVVNVAGSRRSPSARVAQWVASALRGEE